MKVIGGLGRVLKRGAVVSGVAALLLTSCANSPLQLPVGTCFQDPQVLSGVTDVVVVSCDEPHASEVIGLATIAASSFPGSVEVDRRSQELCIDLFSEYLGEPYFASPYEVGWFGPSDESWSGGDREVICFVFDPTGAPMVGSVAGLADSPSA